MLYRYAPSPEDDKDTSAYAKEALQRAISIIDNNDARNPLSPKDGTTRVEVVVILMRFCKDT